MSLIAFFSLATQLFQEFLTCDILTKLFLRNITWIRFDGSWFKDFMLNFSGYHLTLLCLSSVGAHTQIEGCLISIQNPIAWYDIGIWDQTSYLAIIWSPVFQAGWYPWSLWSTGFHANQGLVCILCSCDTYSRSAINFKPSIQGVYHRSIRWFQAWPVLYSSGMVIV